MLSGKKPTVRYCTYFYLFLKEFGDISPMSSMSLRNCEQLKHFSYHCHCPVSVTLLLKQQMREQSLKQGGEHKCFENVMMVI